VITQARDALIDRTLEAISGAPRAIVHLYNSTSELQRRVVFGMSRREVLELAVRATERIREGSERLQGTEITLQYSPESFTGTELDFAVEVVDAVANAWGATPERKMIVNLPSTVETTTPNVFADRIEWIDRNLARRDAIVLSVHTHNDRGTGVASAELAQLAGAERVEGTLLGNGERSGNVDIVTLALNLYSHGVDPGLRFENLPELVRIIEQTTRLPVHPRHPYAGELVFVAFSGSHQDAIHKGLKHMTAESERWEVPYLPIDPADVGRAYEPVIRINSQSGKSGLAHVLERDYGYRVPRALAVEFSRTVQLLSDGRGVELSPEDVRDVFEAEYVAKLQPFALVSAAVERRGECAVHAEIATPSGVSMIAAVGEGPIAAFARGLASLSQPFEIVEYSEHARGSGASAEAVAYVSIRSGTSGDGTLVHGVGRDRDVVLAAFRALLSALNRREAPALERRAG
jgi:2-isopropylmalate synthase